MRILGREGTLVVLLLLVCELAEISVVVIVVDLASLGRLTVVDRGLDHGLDDAHAGYNALDGHELIDQVSLESARRDVVPAEVAVEVHIVLLDFSREGHVVGAGGRLLIHAL